MSLISRREFIKLSTLVLAGFYSCIKLPAYSLNKNFTPFKFAFIPDVHLSNRKFDNWILLNESVIILQDVVKSLNSSDVDFVVFGGDLIDNEQKDLSDLSTFLDVVYQLEKPYYVILGNREARLNNDLSKEDVTCEFRRYGFNQKGRTCWHHNPVAGVDLIGLDTSVINQTEGEISPDQLVWLADKLSNNTNNFKIIALHHPLFPNTTIDSFYTADGFNLTNTDAVNELLNRYQSVNLVLSAHHHLNYIVPKNGVYYINSPSIVTYPCEYRVITVNKDFIEIKNVPINFKQMIKKAKELLVDSDYVHQFESKKAKELVKLHFGDKASRDVKLKA